MADVIDMVALTLRLQNEARAFVARGGVLMLGFAGYCDDEDAEDEPDGRRKFMRSPISLDSHYDRIPESRVPNEEFWDKPCARESHLLPTDKWKKKVAIDHLLFWQPEQVEEMVNLLAAKRYQQVRAAAAKLAADTQDEDGPIAEALPADFATQLYSEVPRVLWAREYIDNAIRHFASFMPIFSTRMKELAFRDGMLPETAPILGDKQHEGDIHS